MEASLDVSLAWRARRRAWRRATALACLPANGGVATARDGVAGGAPTGERAPPSSSKVGEAAPASKMPGETSSPEKEGGVLEGKAHVAPVVGEEVPLGVDSLFHTLKDGQGPQPVRREEQLLL